MMDGTSTTSPAGRSPRLSLDVLMARLREPAFATCYRRAPSFVERSGHVSAAVLAVASPRSAYVRSWRRHARRCPECAGAFRYFGFSVG